MEIVRRGSLRDHGRAATDLKIRRVAWDPKSNSIQCVAYYVADFNTDARHDWALSITLDELAELITAAPVDEAAVALAPALPTLLRIAVQSASHLVGQAPTEQPAA